jgi:hypothetical protein
MLKRWRSVTGGLAIGALAMALACAGIDAQTNSYATLAEARQAGAIANGWMPDGLPAGSHDIREGHVPGTRQRWGVINFPQSEDAALRALLQPEELSLEALSMVSGLPPLSCGRIAPRQGT